jgi:hypothetical protein
MAVNDATVDQLYALFATNNILCMRMWAYMASIFAKTEGVDVEAYIERQRKMSIESADLWKIEGHQDPERIRQIIKAQLNNSWHGIILGATSGSQLQ